MDLISTVDHFLEQRPSPYYACLLLAHPDVRRLQTAVTQLQQHYAWPVIALGRIVSQALLATAPAQRPRQARKLLLDLNKERAPGPVLYSDIDLLFEPEWRDSLDPLQLFKQMSRQTTLIVAWPGTFNNGRLAYAVPEYAHYVAWPRPDLCDGCIVRL